MIPFVARRLLIAVPVLLGVTIVTFVFVNVAPGDPVTALLDPEQMASLGPGWVQQQKAALGLDQPVPVRYVLWLRELARGNLGYSYVDRRAVLVKLDERLGATLELMGTAFVIGLLISLQLGIIAAVKQYSWVDYLSNVVGMAMVSMPGFFVGLACIYLFAVVLRIVPTAGMATIGAPPSFVDGLHHLVLPALILGLASAAPL